MVHDGGRDRGGGHGRPAIEAVVIPIRLVRRVGPAHGRSEGLEPKIGGSEFMHALSPAPTARREPGGARRESESRAGN